MIIGTFDGSRDLSDPWTGFTQFTLLDEKAPDGHMWSGERYRWVKRFVWSLDRFHSIYFIGRKTSKRIHVVREEIKEKTAYIQARSFIGQNSWRKWERNAKLKEKQKWSNEKLHLDNARKLRGIYFIDTERKEFKEFIKNARKKLGTPVAPAMPCQTMKKNCGNGASNKIKTRLACILEARWSYKTAYGRVITKSSWRPYCRKRKQFTTAL